MTKELKLAMRLAAIHIADCLDNENIRRFNDQHPFKGLRHVPNPCDYPPATKVEDVEKMMLKMPAEQLQRILQSSSNFAFITERLLMEAIRNARA